MTVLSSIQAASLSLGLEVPSVVFTNTNRTWIEMRALVNECARQILEEYDWSRLKKIATVTGDGTALGFALPDDYDRMVKDANLWGEQWTFTPSQQVVDFNRWLELQSYAIETWQQHWSVFGGSLNVMPVMPSGEVLRYGYVSNSIVNGSQPEFTADDDTFTLDERLLKLSIIWNWKKSKGQDYAAELQEYEDAMSRARFKDPGSRPSIVSGHHYRYPTGQSFP